MSLGRTIAPAIVHVPDAGTEGGAGITAALARAAASGMPLFTLGTFTITSTIVLPMGPFEWHQWGTYSCTIAGASVTDAAVLAAGTIGSALTLAADPTVGAFTYTVTTTTGLSVGGLVEIVEPNNGQMFRIVSITGSGNPYTITVNRAVRFPYTVAGGAAVYPVTARPTGGRIIAHDAVWTMLDGVRGWELSACDGYSIEGKLTIRAGAAGLSVGLAFDDFGDCNRCSGDIVIDGATYSIGRGFYCENQADGDFEVQVSACDISAEAYACSGTVLRPKRIWNASGATGAGLVLDAQSTQASTGCRVVGGTIEDCAGPGLHMSGGGIGWTIDGLLVQRCGSASSHNILLDTSAGAAPTDAAFVNVRSLASSGAGLAIQGGYRVRVVGGEYGSNANVGISVSAAVQRAMIVGTHTHDNGTAAIQCSGSATITGWSSEDDAGGLYVDSAARVSVTGYEIASRSRAADWHAIDVQGTCVVRATNGRMRAISASTWTITTAYALKDLVVHSSKVYQCTVAGTSAGSGGPTGTGAVIADGTATWKYVAALANAIKKAVNASGTAKVILDGFEIHYSSVYNVGTEQTYVYGWALNTGAKIVYPITTTVTDIGSADTRDVGGTDTGANGWNTYA